MNSHRQKGKHQTARPKRCPKCQGYLNPRSGYPVPIEWACVNCGLTSESESFAKMTPFADCQIKIERPVK